MRYGFYAVYDVQLKSYMRPFFGRSIGEAERSFGDSVRHPDSDIGRHPHDYSLFKIGEFDDESGTLIPEVAPLQIVGAAQLLSADDERLQNVTRRVENPDAARERESFMRRLAAAQNVG